MTILEANKPATINEKMLKNFKNYSNLRDGGRSINLEGAINNGNLRAYGITCFAIIHKPRPFGSALKNFALVIVFKNEKKKIKWWFDFVVCI